MTEGFLSCGCRCDCDCHRTGKIMHGMPCCSSEAPKDPTPHVGSCGYAFHAQQQTHAHTTSGGRGAVGRIEKGKG